MPLDNDTIAQQRTLLTQYRDTLAHLLTQAAQYGGEVFAPPQTANGIAEARAEIARIKAALRAGGVVVEDEPNDDAPPRGHPLDSQKQRNRAKMLDKVENFWIKGVLAQSLYQVARLELGMEHDPKQVQHPWDTVLQRAATQQAISAGTPVISLFNDLDGKLLILGAPGSGKTTLLLELARDLIARARNDAQQPIPLVFNLSTWASKQQTLDKWLTDELNQRYDVPAKLAQAWVEADSIVPLLDGLDEVDVVHREGCVAAINTYRQQHLLVPLVVCCRVADHAALTIKLWLQGAVVIQPLTMQTVDAYLRQIGRPLAGVRAALRDDPPLWELLDSPLLLSIVVLTYKNISPAKLRAAGTPEARRRQLFDDYIAAMFTRPGRSKQLNYTQQQTTAWLSWLAGQMMQHSQTSYYIEQMQPDWLPRRQQRGYSLRVRLLIGLAVGLGGGLAGGLVGGLLIGLVGGLLFGLGVGLDRKFEDIEVTEALRWSWSRDVLVIGLGSGLVIGLGVGLGEGLLGGLGGGLLGGLGAGLSEGLAGAELKVKATPNQGIHRSVRSWLVVGLVFGLVIGLVFGLLSGLLVGLLSGLLVVLVFGLNFGGLAVLQHYTLRWLLYRNGFLPLRLVPFLDYCAERIFLRKVGGGYIFVHRLLMEHFASLQNTPTKQEE